MPGSMRRQNRAIAASAPVLPAGFSPSTGTTTPLTSPRPARVVSFVMTLAAAVALDGDGNVWLWGKNLNENDVAAGQVGADQSTFYQRFTVSPYPRRYGVEFNYNF